MRRIGNTLCVLLLAVPAAFGRVETGGGDDTLLEEITHASFEFFWHEADPQSGLTRDRTGKDICSVASVGFGFAALPIGVERKYVSYASAKERTLKMLKTLEKSNARHNGMFCHFVDLKTGNTTNLGYERAASSIDTALLAAGMLAAGQYFGGDVEQNAQRIFDEINWASFVSPENGQVYMAWQPDDPNSMAGKGRFDKQTWDWYTDETLLIVLLGQACPHEEYRLKPGTMTNWKRPVGRYKDCKPYIYSYPGALFTYMFAHCFYDFRAMGPDGLGVDWFENTRRAVIANRDWCRDKSGKFASYGPDGWGITAGSGPQDTYVVLGNEPRGAKISQDEFGTLHPYGAGMSVPFACEDAVKALRHMRYLKIDGKNLWKPVDGGGYGFLDGFNIDQKWVSGDVIGIAQGPMLLMIENARTGLIWKLMMRDENIKAGIKRAGFKGDLRNN